jgi:hypothetical protein
MRWIQTAVALTLACMHASAAHAQTLNPGPPGPFVFDLRGATSGVPGGAAFFPSVPAGALVPTRGFGGSIGGHVYTLSVGPARVGLGVEVMAVRGTTSDARSTLVTVAPQLSANFGTADGWSYLSAGVGAARVRLDPGDGSDIVRSVNVGGGARWFLGPRLGIGFDVRMHRLAPGQTTPSATALSVAAGLSLK